MRIYTPIDETSLVVGSSYCSHSGSLSSSQRSRSFDIGYLPDSVSPPPFSERARSSISCGGCGFANRLTYEVLTLIHFVKVAFPLYTFMKIPQK